MSDLRLSDYDYELPGHLIARYPLAQRDASRMLVVDRAKKTIAHHHFYELPDFLEPDDLVALNNTKVLPARFIGHRRDKSGTVHTGKTEVLLLNPETGDDTMWTAMMRPARKLPPGSVVEVPGTACTIEILEQLTGGRGRVKVHLKHCPDVPALMEMAGRMPIPPYLQRDAEEIDKRVYQTVYSRVPGAQAAPTAGLHFTREVMDTIQQQGTRLAEVTLNVSAGTFRGVEAEDITQHEMDPELYTVPAETAQAIADTRALGGRVLAVGTTVVKTLETVAHHHRGQIVAESDWSRLFIYAGFRFQVADMLLTNFHLPKTTLLMLVSAFAGRELILKAYEEAVKEEYRFYSYGDCMLIL